MSKLTTKVLMGAVAAVGLASVTSFLPATAAQAQERPGQCKPTPPSFSWDYDANCRRVPKAKGSKDPDGTTRETTQRGTCVKIKEKTENGYRTVDRCD